jgi:hypothetical protein
MKKLLTIALIFTATTIWADYTRVYTSEGTWTISPGLNVYGQQRWSATDPYGRQHTGTRYRGIIIWDD